MRKALCCFLVLSIGFVFSACAPFGRKQISVAGAGYGCTAKITYGDLDVGAKLEASGGGIFKITLLTPESLSGLCFSFNGEQMIVSLGELKSPSVFTNKYGGFASLLNSIFLKLTSGQPVATNTGDDYIFSGTVTGNDFTVICDSKGFPKRIEVLKVGLLAELKDWAELT